MLRFIDTYNDIKKMRYAILEENTDILSAWENYIKFNKNIEDTCVSDSTSYDFENEIQPIIEQALTTDFRQLQEAHENYLTLAKQITSKFNNMFEIDQDINVYFYMGLCNGAGWATNIHGIETVLIGVEKIVELRWHDKVKLESLISHELCHIAHNVIRIGGIDYCAPTIKLNNIWHLYTEGFAERYSQKLNIDGVYSERGTEWTSWCKEHHNEICQEYLHRVNSNKIAQDFFGDWNSYRGHSDLGYYLGCEFIRYIEQDYDLFEIAKLNISTIEELVVEYLRST